MSEETSGRVIPVLLLLGGGVLLYSGFKGEDPRDVLAGAFGVPNVQKKALAIIKGKDAAKMEDTRPLGPIGGNVASSAPGATTPKLRRIVEAVRRKFPDVTVQTFACRKIAGSSSWSQHAYANAADLFRDGWPDSLDPVHAYLKKIQGQMGGYCELIFRQQAGGSPHLNHIHVSAAPCRSGTPQCAGGN